jgi:CHAD domain-containing protein
MEVKVEIINEDAKLVQKVFKDRWQTYRKELKRCRNEPTEEAVHDLRVASCRLLALIDMFRDVAPHPRLKKLRRILKNQLDELDDLRDIQVILVDVSETLVDLPELAPFQNYLNKRERRLLSSTAKSIKSFKYSSIRKRMDSIRKTLLNKDRDIDLEPLMLQAVDISYAAVLRRYQRVEPANPATLFRLRIAFKKFRFMVEICHPLVSKFPEDNFKELHDYQGMMGDIQDVEIILSTFEEFAEGDPSYVSEPVLRYYRQRYLDVVNAFLEDIHQINTFWRPAPDSSFPWEIGQHASREQSN